MTRETPSATGQMLDRIDTENYAAGLLVFLNEADAVKNELLREPEVRFLIQHHEQAMPLMLKRMKEGTIFCYHKTRMIYFVIFEQWNDYHVLPAIADYLEATHTEENCLDGNAYYTADIANDVVKKFTVSSIFPNNFVSSRARNFLVAQLARSEFLRRNNLN